MENAPKGCVGHSTLGILTSWLAPVVTHDSIGMTRSLGEKEERKKAGKGVEG